MELNAADVLVNEKRFVGSIGGSCAPDHDFPKFLEWQSNGDLDLDAMVTARYSIDQINEAVAALEKAKLAAAPSSSLITNGLPEALAPAQAKLSRL